MLKKNLKIEINFWTQQYPLMRIDTSKPLFTVKKYADVTSCEIKKFNALIFYKTLETFFWAHFDLFLLKNFNKN